MSTARLRPTPPAMTRRPAATLATLAASAALILTALFAWRGAATADDTLESPASAALATTPPDPASGPSAVGPARVSPDGDELVARLRAALALHDPEEQGKAFALALRGLSPDNLDAVLAFFSTLPRHGSAQGAFLRLARAWGRFDGDAALGYMLAELPGIHGLDGALEAARAWTAYDHATATQRIASLTSLPGQDYLLYGLAYPLARHQPDWAFRWAATSDLPHRDNILLHLAIGWLDRDPAAALDFISTHAEPLGLATAVAEACRRLARQGLDEALAWTETLPAGDIRQSAWALLVDWWADSDPGTIATWLDQAEAAPRYDPIYARFAVSLARNDLAAAHAWARAIGDEALRRETVETIIQVASSE